MSRFTRLGRTAAASPSQPRASTAPGELHDAPPAEPPATGIKRWWQWLLLYPTFAVAVLGAVPTYWDKYQAQKLGVESGRSAWALRQTELWKRNMECSAAPFEWVQTADNTKVDATICHTTGDIFVRFLLAQGGQVLAFVSKDELTGGGKAEGAKMALSDLLLPTAHAATPLSVSSGQPETVLCQRWIADGRLLRRVSTPQGCFDLVVNTYKGVVESSTSAPCNPRC